MALSNPAVSIQQECFRPTGANVPGLTERMYVQLVAGLFVWFLARSFDQIFDMAGLFVWFLVRSFDRIFDVVGWSGCLSGYSTGRSVLLTVSIKRHFDVSLHSVARTFQATYSAVPAPPVSMLKATRVFLVRALCSSFVFIPLSTLRQGRGSEFSNSAAAEGNVPKKCVAAIAHLRYMKVSLNWYRQPTQLSTNCGQCISLGASDRLGNPHGRLQNRRLLSQGRNPLRVCWRPIVDTLQARYKPVAE